MKSKSGILSVIVLLLGLHSTNLFALPEVEGTIKAYGAVWSVVDQPEYLNYIDAQINILPATKEVAEILSALDKAKLYSCTMEGHDVYTGGDSGFRGRMIFSLKNCRPNN